MSTTYNYILGKFDLVKRIGYQSKSLTDGKTVYVTPKLDLSQGDFLSYAQTLRTPGLYRPHLPVAFLLSVSAAVICSVLAIIVSSKDITLPSVLRDSTYFTRQQSAPTAKLAYLHKIERGAQQQRAAQVLFLTNLIRDTRKATKDPKTIARSIVIESERQAMDPLYVASVIFAESTFRRNARSRVGALGLMQIMPATGRWISRTEQINWKGTQSLINDPAYNIRLGVTYLKRLEKQFDGNKRLALIAYNWGPTNLTRALKEKRSTPKISRRYADKILNYSKKWRAEYASIKDQYQRLPSNFLTS